MALTEAEKKEMQDTMARGIADGLRLFRSETEEEAAKNPPQKEPEKKGGENDGVGGIDLAGFILGRK